MANNTIGQFIAALRKANGMTQQEVADRLNVSNKAVSRWERDECSPDISLIPSLAEMFGVTCDELLKGERILEAAVNVEKKEPKVQKQIKNLIGRALSGFKTLIYISLALSAVGLICMFGISYGFYRPQIGFAVMLLLEVAAVFLAVLAVSRARAVKTDNEIFEEAEDSLTAEFDKTLGTFSFNAFFCALSTVLLSLPLILAVSDYVESVIAFSDYCTFFLAGIALILALVFLKGRKPYIKRFTKNCEKVGEPATRKIRLMDMVQIGLITVSGVILTVLPRFETSYEEKGILPVIAGIAVYACYAAVLVCFVLFLLKNKELRKDLILPGIRNIFLIPSAISFSHIYWIWWSSPIGAGENDLPQYEKRELFSPEYIWYTFIYAALVIVIFSVIDILAKRGKSHK